MERAHNGPSVNGSKVLGEFSNPHDILGLQTLRPLLHLELHFRALVQCAITIGLDGGKMDEYIIARWPLDKPIAFGGVKPLHNSSFLHYTFS